MEIDRREFLKWTAGLAALAAVACKSKTAAPVPQAVFARASLDGVLYKDTVLRECGVAHATQVECWDGQPIGVRGRATAGLLDLLPSYWTLERLQTPLWHGSSVSIVQAQLLLTECIYNSKGKPLLLVAPPVSSAGLATLLSAGTEQELWEAPLADPSVPSARWDNIARRMASGEFAGMLLLGLHDSCQHNAALAHCWQAAPWRGAMTMAKNTWTSSADLAWPAPHPFAALDRHALPDGSVRWQRPVVPARPGEDLGIALLLAAWQRRPWASGLWEEWLEQQNPVSALSALASSIELEYPRSPWYNEVFAAVDNTRVEPTLQWASAVLPRTNGKKRWGMLVDLRRCTRCRACVLACAVENNIPVIGDEELRKGRALHWLRLAQGIPLMCQHCAQAPCEAACPVRATTHSSDGLNEQTYARCVGIRYCAIHCPWKTRRFGFGVLAGQGLQMQFNPRVPLRPQGVMEKCTFCVQRIRDARPDQQVVSACAEACPSGALHFGDWNDPHSPPRLAAQGEALWRLASLGSEEPSVLYIRDGL